MGISYKGGKLMAKIYYGDENNTAVELNIGVSQEYVDSQIEAVSGDIHSIPAGGTTGQVLSKVDGTDYNTVWADPNAGGLQYWTENTDDRSSLESEYNFLPKASEELNSLPGLTVTVAKDRSQAGIWDTVYISSRAGNGYKPGFYAADNYISVVDANNTQTYQDGMVLTLVDATEGMSWQAEWKTPSGSDPNAIKIDGTSVTTAQIPFAQGISAAGSSAFTGTVTVPAPTSNEHAANKQYVDEAVASAGSGGLNYTPDVWVFSIPSSEGTSPYAYYYTESADTPQYRKTNATFETISEHWCKLKLFFEVDCEEEKNAWPSLSPNIQAIVNSQSSTILSHYPGKSINNSYSSPIYYWGGYMDTGSSGESSVKTVESDTFTISELNGTDENAAVGWQIPDSIIPSGTNYVTTYGFWEYWIRLD